MSNKLTSKLEPYWTLALIVCAAALIGIVFFLIALDSDKQVNQRERQQLVEMTNGFTEVFSEVRGEHSPIPAEFRRLGVQKFSEENANLSSNSTTIFRVPGLPGLELGSRSDDPRVRELINDVIAAKPEVELHETRFEDGRLIGRTLVPSVARSEACVTCHNQALGRPIYEVGDVMGAFVVESDLTQELKHDLQYAFILFLLSFAALWLIVSREKKHHQYAIDLEADVQRAQLHNRTAEIERFYLLHDPLTDLPNRQLFNDQLKELLQENSDGTICAALVDLDDFKSVNDTMGHHVGDKLLCEIAQRLRNYVASWEGFAARLGGDEFALAWVTPKSEDSCDRFAAGLLAEVTKTVKVEHWEISPTASIGIAAFGSGKIRAQGDLLKAADASLYAAKGDGKNTYKVYDEKIDTSLHRRSYLTACLPAAIENGNIRIALQPKINLQDASIVGFEALSRWCLNGEEIPPKEFIPLAEATGVVHKLDELTLRGAVEFAKQLQTETGTEFSIAVNFSANSLCSKAMVDLVRDVLSESELTPGTLIIEVTESAAIKNWSAVQDVITRLRKIGVKTALDDFGTGYSSLAYLLRMSFDEIKIDREFVRDVRENSKSYVLLQHIAELANDLELNMVIEGIETEEQADLLVNSVSNFVGQGYCFSKPLEPNEARDYFLQSLDQELMQQKLQAI